MKRHFLCLVLLLWDVQETHAEIGFDSTGEHYSNAVYTAVGFDASILTWELGYARTLPLDRIERHVTLFGDISLAMFRPDFSDFRVRVGPRIDAFRRRWFVLPVALSITVIGTENSLVSGIGIGTELGTMPGYYGAKWFVAAELYWLQTWASRLQHSDRFRETVYEDVNDGWYRMPAVIGRFGARVGGIVLGRVEILLRGGYEQHGKYNRFVPPFYAIFAADVRF